MQSNVTCVINCNHMYLSNPSHICLIACIRSTEKCMLCFVCYIVPLYSIVYLKKCSRMALDGTSYPLLCTLSALCTSVPGRMSPCCACECHLTDLKILRLKQAQVGRHHVTGAQNHLGTGRRRTTQDDSGRRGTTRDDAGRRRMVQDGQKHVGPLLLSTTIP